MYGRQNKIVTQILNCGEWIQVGELINFQFPEDVD